MQREFHIGIQKRGMYRMRTIQSEMTRNGIVDIQNVVDSKIKEKMPTEQLSKRDIEELMGVRRNTFKKKHGAFRQR